MSEADLIIFSVISLIVLAIGVFLLVLGNFECEICFFIMGMFAVFIGGIGFITFAFYDDEPQIQKDEVAINMETLEETEFDVTFNNSIYTVTIKERENE